MELDRTSLPSPNSVTTRGPVLVSVWSSRTCSVNHRVPTRFTLGPVSRMGAVPVLWCSDSTLYIFALIKSILEGCGTVSFPPWKKKNQVIVSLR